MIWSLHSDVTVWQLYICVCLCVSVRLCIFCEFVTYYLYASPKTKSVSKFLLICMCLISGVNTPLNLCKFLSDDGITVCKSFSVKKVYGYHLYVFSMLRG